MKLGRKAFFFRLSELFETLSALNAIVADAAELNGSIPHVHSFVNLDTGTVGPNWPPVLFQLMLQAFLIPELKIMESWMEFSCWELNILEIFPFNLCTVSFCITLIRHTAAYRFNDENVALSALPHLFS